MTFASNRRRVLATGGLFAIFVVSGIFVARGESRAMKSEPLNPPKAETTTSAQTQAGALTAEAARHFAEAAERRLLPLWVAQSRASWVQETFITPDTEEMAAEADQAVKAATADLAGEARRYEGLKLPEDVAPKIKLIKLSVDIPAPRDTAESTELPQYNASLQNEY